MGIRDEQLKKVELADLSQFNPETNTYSIPKYTKPIYDVGKCYLILINQQILNNITSVLAVNWNHGTAPTWPYYKAYVSKTMGKMIYIDGLAYDMTNKQDLTNMWSGWLDTELISQLAIL